MKNIIIVPFEKTIDKDKFNNKRKLSVVFDRAMSNVYKNNIFLILPCVVVEIHDIKQPIQLS